MKVLDFEKGSQAVAEQRVSFKTSEALHTPAAHTKEAIQEAAVALHRWLCKGDGIGNPFWSYISVCYGNRF